MVGFIIALSVLGIAGFIYGMRHRKSRVAGHYGHSHDNGVFSIDIIAYGSGIRHWNPMFKVAFAIALLLICVVADKLYVSVLVIAITAYVTVVLGKVHCHEYIDLMKIPVVFMILGSIAILINFSTVPRPALLLLDCRLFYIFVTASGVRQILFLWAKVFGAVSAMYMLSLSTPSTEIFGVLKRIRLPGLIIELMNMIYRYIFILLDTNGKMKNAAVSRLGYVDFKTSVSTFGHTMSNLLIVSMKKANSYFDAMEARCYDGDFVFLEEDKPLRPAQIVFGITMIAVLVAVWIFA